MTGLNDAFYSVFDKLFELQSYFRGVARSIAQVVLVIAVCSMAVNYALTGTGLKENIIKLLKAVVFYAVVMAAYPRIVSWMTVTTLSWGQGAAFAPAMEGYISSTRRTMAESAEQTQINNTSGTYGQRVMMSERVTADGDPEAYFGPVVGKSRKGNTTVVPAAFLQVILLTAGDCLKFADPPENEKPGLLPKLPDFGKVLKGLLCGFFVIIVGVFALIEYLIAYLEFIFVSSVGIFLFPFSMWDGSKFLTEKFISALTGFFIKLLFSTICIFLALYGFSSLAHRFVEIPFTGLPNEIVFIAFSCLLYFYLCKSAPAMAQSLMTGSPSLNAAGAIAASAAAVGAVAGTAGLGARAAMSGAGTLARAGGAFAGAAGASRELGGGALEQFGQGVGAFAGSLGGSAAGAVQNGAEDLTRSLMAKPASAIAGLGNTGPGGGGAAGYDRNNIPQRFLHGRNEDGSRKDFRDVLGDLSAEGRTSGRGFVTGQAIGMLPNNAIPETTTATSRAQPENPAPPAMETTTAAAPAQPAPPERPA